MSVEAAVTVTAKNPPTLDLTVEMPGPMPTDPYHQQRWTEELDRRVGYALDELDQRGEGYESYMAEYFTEWAGGWDVKVSSVTVQTEVV